MRLHFTRSLFWLGVLTLGTSCAQNATDPEPDASLLRKRWLLEQVDGMPVGLSSHSADFNSYLQLSGAGNQVQGLAGCDEIGGQFSLITGTKQLSFQLSVRQGNCGGPTMAGRFLLALPQTTRYELNGTQLLLYDAQNVNPRIAFKADN